MFESGKKFSKQWVKLDLRVILFRKVTYKIVYFFFVDRNVMRLHMILVQGATNNTSCIHTTSVKIKAMEFITRWRRGGESKIILEHEG